MLHAANRGERHERSERLCGTMITTSDGSRERQKDARWERRTQRPQKGLFERMCIRVVVPRGAQRRKPERHPTDDQRRARPSIRCRKREREKDGRLEPRGRIEDRRGRESNDYERERRTKGPSRFDARKEQQGCGGAGICQEVTELGASPSRRNEARMDGDQSGESGHWTETGKNLNLGHAKKSPEALGKALISARRKYLSRFAPLAATNKTR